MPEELIATVFTEAVCEWSVKLLVNFYSTKQQYYKHNNIIIYYIIVIQ